MLINAYATKSSADVSLYPEFKAGFANLYEGVTTVTSNIPAFIRF